MVSLIFKGGVEFDEKNEVLSNYEREYIDMYMEDNWKGEDMGIQAEILNQVRSNIRYYSSKIKIYSILNIFFSY